MAMVGNSCLLVIACFHSFVTSASGLKATESEANLAHSRTFSGLQRVDDSLHTHAEKQAATAARLRGLRSHRSLSSHSLSANVFRAAATTGSRGGIKHLQVPGAVPLYTPKMGIANVTEPTAFPPPPPVLSPWKDMQPLDTAVGNYIISGFLEQPTVTPPPSQSSLDLAFACPALLTWPAEVSVSAPDPCAGRISEGNWTTTGGDGELFINWGTSCIDTTTSRIKAASVSAVTTFTVPNGDLFGTSQQVLSLDTMAGGGRLVIRDCGGATVYTVEEKMYKQIGKADDDSCEKYGSCDGIVYLQYFMKNIAGETIALTSYLTIFQANFDITDTAGVKIASVTRNGWAAPEEATPEYCADAKPRKWILKYEKSPPGVWAAVPAQWPLAAMMTMLAQRDEKRLPNGKVVWDNCETMKSGGWVVILVVGFSCCVCIPMAIFLLCSAPILRLFGNAESKFMPKRMGRPGRYN